MSSQENCELSSSCLNFVPVFQGMKEEEISALQEVTESQCFHKGEFIFHEGERSEKLFIINHGLIKLTKLSDDGKEQIIRLLFPGDFFGLVAMLKDVTHYSNAEALDHTDICYIKKEDFLKTMERNPDMSYRFILSLNDRLLQADEWVSLLSLMEVEQRLARVLLLFYDKIQPETKHFTLPVTKKDMACLIGTTPETLSRRLVSFVAQNIITMNGRREITIVDFEKLSQIAGK